MGKRKQLSISERAKIVHSYKMLKSIRKVCASLNHPYSTVLYTINRFKETNSNMDRRGRGNFQSLSSSDKRFIKILSKRDRTKTLPFLTEEFNIARKKNMFSKHCSPLFIGLGIKRTCGSQKASIEKAKCCKEVGICERPCNLDQ